MVETEWTFKIPETLKKAVKKERATFSVNYKLAKAEVIKTITVVNLKHNTTRDFNLFYLKGAELENEISNFLYAERVR